MSESNTSEDHEEVNDRGSKNGVVIERTARIEQVPADEDQVNKAPESEIPAEEDFDPLEDFPDETEDLDLVHSRISSLENYRLSRFAGHLKRLYLRQNFIAHLDPAIFNALTRLEELDLYDNQIKTVDDDALKTLTNLSTLDLSFNLLKSVPESLEHLKSLKTIYLVENRITKITGLLGVGATLRSLELGGNKIRKIENVDALVNLEELLLRFGVLTESFSHQNLGNLKRLKILALQSNRITKIEGLEELESLTELYLSHNGVETIEGLDHNAIAALHIGRRKQLHLRDREPLAPWIACGAMDEQQQNPQPARAPGRAGFAPGIGDDLSRGEPVPTERGSTRRGSPRFFFLSFADCPLNSTDAFRRALSRRPRIDSWCALSPIRPLPSGDPFHIRSRILFFFRSDPPTALHNASVSRPEWDDVTPATPPPKFKNRRNHRPHSGLGWIRTGHDVDSTPSSSLHAHLCARRRFSHLGLRGGECDLRIREGYGRTNGDDGSAKRAWR
ncbi:hypothetical protein EW146_g8631 [Bondarzewia mesenterica]|uniref:Protein phosphatase 1 regulatory subunit 7 n=1 Tax=Bondarzewia mesenterica TaxID=1095465 RepID=A0A4S4LCW6_9AGAM|nr:hypothetical protein EW146_g8631 [Bondarzewia mesenterica]